MGNYSEEEEKAIDILTNEIADIVVGEYCTHCKICGNENRECYYSKAIGTVCSIIIRQQKEIEELKKPKYMMNFETGTIMTIDSNFISKDKIREKIKKEEKYKETTKKLFPDSFNYHMQEYAIKVLNELLEE